MEEVGELPDGGKSVDRLVQEGEERRRVEQAIDSLPEDYRNVTLLYYDQKLSYEEIAEVLRIPMRTVETRLYRARRKLRELLSKEASE